MHTPDLDLSHAYIQALSGARRWQQSVVQSRKEAEWARVPGSGRVSFEEHVPERSREAVEGGILQEPNLQVPGACSIVP